MNRFSPTDAKFVTAHDKDKTLRIWDLETGVPERSMSNIFVLEKKIFK